MSTSDQIDALARFRAAMLPRGLSPGEIIQNGEIHRFRTEDGKPGTKDGAYLYHSDSPAAGGFQNHTDGIGWENWCSRTESEVDPAQWREHLARQAADKKRRETKLAQERAEARTRDTQRWNAAKEGPHPYLDRKGILPHGTRVDCVDGENRLLVPVRDVKGGLHGLQRITPDGTKLFTSGTAKTGHFFIIGEIKGEPHERVVQVEGFGTGATVRESTGYPVVVAFDAGNQPSVAKVIVNKFSQVDLLICGDDDWKRPDNPGVTDGQKAASATRARFIKPVWTGDRPEKSTDFDDLARDEGRAVVKAQIGAAFEATKPAPAEATVRRLRPEIEVGTDESRVVDEAIAALAIAQEVYVRGPEIVEIVTDTPATRGVTRVGPLVRIHRSPEPRVRELLSTYAQWMSTGRDGESLVEAHPPLWAVRAVVSRGHWPALRPLIAVAEAPTMRPDGTIITEPGYDPATGIYLAPGVRVTIPDHPTRGQAIAAVAVLADIIGDFPLASEAGRSAWIAGVLTAAVRPAIDGPAPMIIIDASVPGAGKTLMVDASAMITTGRPAARTTFVADDAEMRKRITAIALAGDPLALLDNVVGTIGCPSLDAALTGTTWRDRVLGSSAMTGELPMRTVWWATGNGLVIGADLVRRALLVRLEPMVERPEERSGWRHPRLLDHVRDVRAELLSAALTIPRAYAVAGRPDQGLTPMGSYTAWSDLVRSAVVWVGMADPCATIGEIRACDPRADALAGLLATWPAAPDTPVNVAELLAAATPGTPWRAVLCEWCPPRGADLLPVSRALGNRLRGVRRRVVSGQYIDAGPHGRGGVSWLLRATGPRLPGRDSVTPVTLVSRYTCNEQVQNIDIAGRTVTTVTQSQGSDDGPADDNAQPELGEGEA